MKVLFIYVKIHNKLFIYKYAYIKYSTMNMFIHLIMYDLIFNIYLFMF